MRYCACKCILNKIYRPFEKYLAPIHRQGLNTNDFTIISNNCWGGRVYQYFGIEYKTPTIGMYFFPSDFNQFCNNLDFYITRDPVIVDWNESKWKKYLTLQYNIINMPLIARINDIELILLHYHSELDFKNKWKRRRNRINWDSLIFKSNDQNFCTEFDCEEFCTKNIDQNRIFFTANQNWFAKYNCTIFYKDDEMYGFVKDDTMFPCENINMKSFINNLAGWHNLS